MYVCVYVCLFLKWWQLWALSNLHMSVQTYIQTLALSRNAPFKFLRMFYPQVWIINKKATWHACIAELACSCMYVCMYVCVFYVCTYIHTHTGTHVLQGVHAREPMCAIYICVYKHTYIYTWIRRNIHIHIHTSIHTRIRMYCRGGIPRSDTYIHTYINICKHTYTHTYIHTYTHTHVLQGWHPGVRTKAHVCNSRSESCGEIYSTVMWGNWGGSYG